MHTQDKSKQPFRQHLIKTGQLTRIEREIQADRAAHSETQFKVLFWIFVAAGILFPVAMVAIYFADVIIEYFGLTKTVINWILSG